MSIMLSPFLKTFTTRNGGFDVLIGQNLGHLTCGKDGKGDDDGGINQQLVYQTPAGRSIHPARLYQCR
ncbi:MAG: hypothetical protein R6U68_15130 [Desulfobacteraceae bacterium]